MGNENIRMRVTAALLIAVSLAMISFAQAETLQLYAAGSLKEALTAAAQRLADFICTAGSDDFDRPRLAPSK